MDTVNRSRVDFLVFFDYNFFMPRPKKDPAMRMDTDLRIPLTAEQKSIIDEATANAPEGKAAWARAILLASARDQIAKSDGQKPRARGRNARGG